MGGSRTACKLKIPLCSEITTACCPCVVFIYFKMLENSLRYSVHPEISRVTFQKAKNYLTVTRGNGFSSSSEFGKITDI